MSLPRTDSMEINVSFPTPGPLTVPAAISTLIAPVAAVYIVRSMPNPPSSLLLPALPTKVSLKLLPRRFSIEIYVSPAASPVLLAGFDKSARTAWPVKIVRRVVAGAAVERVAATAATQKIVITIAGQYVCKVGADQAVDAAIAVARRIAGVQVGIGKIGGHERLRMGI